MLTWRTRTRLHACGWRPPGWRVVPPPRLQDGAQQPGARPGGTAGDQPGEGGGAGGCAAAGQAGGWRRVGEVRSGCMHRDARCLHGMYSTCLLLLQGTPEGNSAKRRLPELMGTLRWGGGVPGGAACVVMGSACQTLSWRRRCLAGRRSWRWWRSARRMSAWPKRRRSCSSAWRGRRGVGMAGRAM